MADIPDARDDEDLIVKLDDDPADSGAAKEAKPEQKLAPVPGPGKQTSSPVDGLKELEGQIVAERNRAARMEELARTATTERDRAVAVAEEAQRRGVSQQEVAIDNQITNATNEIDRITEMMEGAYNEGDFKKVINFQRDLTKLGGQLAVYQRDKQWAQNRAAQLKQQGARQPTEEPLVDPFETSIRSYSPAARDFLRSHRELVRSDGTLKRIAVDAHEKALDAGLKGDTQEYFAHVEATLKAGPGWQPGSTEGSFSAAPERGEPLDRQPVNGVQLGANGEFRMTPKMRRLAAEQGVSDQEWAKNYVRLVKEGRMTPITG